MKVRLTGIIEIQTEFETEIDSEEFFDWYRVIRWGYYNAPLEFEDLHPDDKSIFIEKYLKDCSDHASEIWATAPRVLNEYEVLAADFVDAEVLDDCKN